MSFPLSEQARSNMRHVASSRATMWSILASLFSLPNQTLATSLKDGSLVKSMRSATAWAAPNQGNTTLGAIYCSLDFFGTNHQDLSKEQTTLLLEGAYQTLIKTVDEETLSSLVSAMLQQVSWCSEEAVFWEENQIEAARNIRLQQHTQLEKTVVDTLAQTCETMADIQDLVLYRDVGWLGLCVLSIESGRGYIPDTL